MSNRRAFLYLTYIWVILLSFLCQRNGYSAQQRKAGADRGKQRISRPRSAFSLKSESMKASTPPSNNFCNGVNEYHRGSYAKASDYLKAARSDSHDLSDYVLYYLGRSLEELGEQQQAISIFQELLAQYPQSRFTPKATVKVADLFFLLKKYDSAREYYQKSLDHVPDRKDYILFQTALSFMDEKKWREARSVLKKILTQFPCSQYAKLSTLCNQELEKEYHLEPLSFSEEEQMDIIQSSISDGEYKQAMEKIEQLRKRPSLSSGCKSHLLYQEAKCYSKLGQKDKTLETLRKLVSLYPASDDVDSSLLLMGYILWNQDRDAEALEIYSEVTKKFGKRPDVADKAWYHMGRIHEQGGNYQKAISCFGNLTRTFSRSDHYPEALWRIGWDYYQQGKFQEARVHFKNGLTKVDDPSDRHQFLYWQARSAEKSHDSEGALELYRTLVSDTSFSYYSWLARQRIEDWTAPPLKTSFPGKVGVTRVSYSSEVYFHLGRAKKLLEYRLKDEAKGEVKVLMDLRESDPWYWYNLSKLAQEAGLHREAVLAGWRCQRSLARQGKSETYSDVLELLYPLHYWEHIQKYTDEYNLDPLIVCSLMRQESMFDPQSLSRARAYGLMQIIPSTARMIASRLKAYGGRHFNVERLYDPETNIAFGCWYLADLLQRLEGNVIYALISYNAGEDALKKWRDQYATATLDEFVEMISYKETRDYVKKVIRNYGHYSWLYSNQATSSNQAISSSPGQMKGQGSQVEGKSDRENRESEG
ncbi:MAG: tetratricopeptide repeat protein [bacterium]